MMQEYDKAIRNRCNVYPSNLKSVYFMHLYIKTNFIYINFIS